MTVKELIARLQAFDPEAEVRFRDLESGRITKLRDFLLEEGSPTQKILWLYSSN